MILALVLHLILSHCCLPGQVNSGPECGIGMEDYDDWEVGDKIEVFSKVQKRRTLEEASASMTTALEGVGIGLSWR